MANKTLQKLGSIRAYLLNHFSKETSEKTIQVCIKYPSLFYIEVAEVISRNSEMADEIINWTANENSHRGIQASYDVQKKEFHWPRYNDKRIDPRDVAEVLKENIHGREYLDLSHRTGWQPERDISRIIKISSPERWKEIMSIATENKWHPFMVSRVFDKSHNPSDVFQLAIKLRLDDPQALIQVCEVENAPFRDDVIRIVQEKGYHPEEVLLMLREYSEYFKLTEKIASDLRPFEKYPDLKGKHGYLFYTAFELKHQPKEVKKKYIQYIDEWTAIRNEIRKRKKLTTASELKE